MLDALKKKFKTEFSVISKNAFLLIFAVNKSLSACIRKDVIKRRQLNIGRRDSSVSKFIAFTSVWS